MKQNKEEAQVVIMQREKHPPRQIDQTNYKQREREKAQIVTWKMNLLKNNTSSTAYIVFFIVPRQRVSAGVSYKQCSTRTAEKKSGKLYNLES